ncbi:MAG: protein-disulfide reductase DsbD [Pseudomonadota bacterium]
MTQRLISIITLVACTLLAGNKLFADSHEIGEELLDPEIAFAASSRVLDANNLEVSFEIAPGYYLYRDKFSFASLSPDVSLGTPLIPAGKVKHDEFFGEVETHRNSVTIQVPFVGDGALPETLELQTVSQGCADIGVCYPPLKQVMLVSLADLEPTIPSSLSSLFSGDDNSLGEPELLDPDQAFALAVLPIKGDEIQLEWAIADGYYLYNEKFEFSLQDAGATRLGTPTTTPGKLKHYEFFGETEVHRGLVQARLPLENLSAATEAVLNITYQGCADIGVCYPPTKRQIPVSLTPQGTDSAPSAASTPIQLTEQDQIASTLANENYWWTVLLFLGLGIGLAFTPCVFPMVPILSSIIVGQGPDITPRKAFGLSLVYVLAMATTYTIAGIFVGLSGENIQIWFQTPWVLISFAVLFVLLSLAMFGFYELQMPASIQARLTQWSNSQRGGTLIGVAIMGFLSALIVGPCITAPLVGALIYIAETGDAVLGGIALFSLSIGMGVPLLLIGTSAGSLLPRAGTWMEGIKSVFGILLLGLAIWMLERILPAVATQALVALLIIASAVYLRALEPVEPQASGWAFLRKFIGVALLIYGVMLAIAAASGGASYFKPLASITSGTSGPAATTEHLEFTPIKGVDGLQVALQNAGDKGRTTMLDFYADWCISCKEMEAFTFTESSVQQLLSKSQLIQADVTANDEIDVALLKQIGIFGPPAILFYDAQGEEIPNSRVVGFMDAERFSAHLERVLPQ